MLYTYIVNSNTLRWIIGAIRDLILNSFHRLKNVNKIQIIKLRVTLHTIEFEKIGNFI